MLNKLPAFALGTIFSLNALATIEPASNSQKRNGGKRNTVLADVLIYQIEARKEQANKAAKDQ